MTHDTLDPTLAQTLSSDEEASQEGVERPLSSTNQSPPFTGQPGRGETGHSFQTVRRLTRAPISPWRGFPRCLAGCAPPHSPGPHFHFRVGGACSRRRVSPN